MSANKIFSAFHFLKVYVLSVSIFGICLDAPQWDGRPLFIAGQVNGPRIFPRGVCPTTRPAAAGRPPPPHQGAARLRGPPVGADGLPRVPRVGLRPPPLCLPRGGVGATGIIFPRAPRGTSTCGTGFGTMDEARDRGALFNSAPDAVALPGAFHMFAPRWKVPLGLFG